MKTKWFSRKFGTTVHVDADTKKKLSVISAETSGRYGLNKWSVDGSFDVIKRATQLHIANQINSLTGEISYDSAGGDSVLKCTQELNPQNSISASLGLKSISMTYEWCRKWTGGSLTSTFYPSDKKLGLKWRDKGAIGTWTTVATVPIDNAANTKVTFSHDWDY